MGVLVLRIQCGKNLMSADKNGFSDPYVVARLPGTRLKAWRSKTCWKTLNPEWNQVHEFPGYLSDLASKPLELSVMDQDTFARDDPLGTLAVPLFDLLQQRARRRASTVSVAQNSELHFNDQPLQGVESGTITFSVSFELKFGVALLPGTPVHASAAQALRRPPPADASSLERSRDKLLLCLGHKIFLTIAILWLLALIGFGGFCVIAYGALYVPYAIVAIQGNETTDVEAAAAEWNAIGLNDEALEWWANACVQILTMLFSYFNILTLPWRLSILWHMCGKRSDAPGRDFYGRPTDAIWFHIPNRPRAVIVICLITSTISHFSTQTSRVVYHSYYLAATMPGATVCNVTFGCAVLFGIFAGVVQGLEEKKLRRQHPERYPPTLADHIQVLRKKGDFSWWQLMCCRFSKLRKSHKEDQGRWLIEKEVSCAAAPPHRRTVACLSSTAPPAVLPLCTRLFPSLTGLPLPPLPLRSQVLRQAALISSRRSCRSAPGSCPSEPSFRIGSRATSRLHGEQSSKRSGLVHHRNHPTHHRSGRAGGDPPYSDVLGGVPSSHGSQGSRTPGSSVRPTPRVDDEPTCLRASSMLESAQGDQPGSALHARAGSSSSSSAASSTLGGPDDSGGPMGHRGGGAHLHYPGVPSEQGSLESARRAQQAILLASAPLAHAQPQQPQLLASPGSSRASTLPPMGMMQLSADGGLSVPSVACGHAPCMLRRVMTTPCTAAANAAAAHATANAAASAGAAASGAVAKPHKLRLVPLVPLERYPRPKQGLKGPARDALDRERELRRGETYARLAAQLADLESTLVAGQAGAEEAAEHSKTIEQLQVQIEQLRATRSLPIEVSFSGAPAGLTLTTEADGSTVVQQLISGSEADVKSVPIGSRLASINGRSINGMSQAEVKALIAEVAAEGSPYTCTLLVPEMYTVNTPRPWS